MADKVFTTTADFDAGTKTNVATITDQYTTIADQLELLFPYADKDADLQMYLRMESEVAGVTPDETVNANNGTVVGAIATASGKFDKGYGFDGVDDEINLGTPASLNIVGDLSISIWVYPTASKLQYILVKQDGTGYNRNYVIVATADNTITVLRGNGANTQGVVTSTDVVTLNAWNHVTLTDSSKNLSVYINAGTPVSQTYTFTPTNNNNPVYIGWGYNGGVTQRHFAGKIDEPKIYSRALSAAEITALYNAGNKYTSTGNWLSPAQTNTKPISQVDVTLANGDAANYVNIVILKALDDSEITRADGIQTTRTLTTVDFNNGLAGTNLNYKVKIEAVGAGTKSVALQEIGITYASGHGLLLSCYRNRLIGGN